MKRVGTLGGRTLLLVALAMTVTMGVTFVVVDTALRVLARERIEDAIERGERSMDAADANFKRQQIEWLGGISQHSGLRAALARKRGSNKQAIEAALSEIGSATDMNLLATSDGSGRLLVAVANGHPETLPAASPPPAGEFRILNAGGHLYEAAEIPLPAGGDATGLLVGREVRLSKIPHNGYLALTLDSAVIDSDAPVPVAIPPWSADGTRREVSIAGERYLAIPIRPASFHAPYRLWSLQSIDLPVAEITRGMHRLFIDVSALGMALVVAFAVFVSRSTARPLSRLVAIVRECGHTGKLTATFPADFHVVELNLLAEALNGAARSANDSRNALDRAHEQFIETMAQALDARDPYTAGHSLRVAAYSHAIAKELGLNESASETIRLAAQLHDIGKIGIPDAVLQKPGRLTPDEYGLIKLHPQIGRKILEKVGHFEKLLDVVELHHENPDGTGYPYGLKSDRTPLDARIVHVADSFDAMTSTRSYRSALTFDEGVAELKRHAGRQFDAEIVEAFVKLLTNGEHKDLFVASDRSLIVERFVKPSRQELFLSSRH